MNRRIRQARKLATLLAQHGYRRGLRHRVAAAIEHADLIKSLKLSTVLDVGANVGQFSLLVTTLHPAATIYAFEPLAGPANVFQRLFARQTNVHLYQVAIAPSSGPSSMFVSARNDSSSLLPITTVQTSTFPGTQALRSEEVRLARLDECLSEADIIAPALLKLDVQGFELEALHGCESLLHLLGHVLVEVSFLQFYGGQPLASDIITYLTAQGFALVGVYNITYNSTGLCVQCDCLFTRAVNVSPNVRLVMAAAR